MSNSVMFWNNINIDLNLFKKNILNKYEEVKESLPNYHTGYRMELKNNDLQSLQLDKVLYPYFMEYLLLNNLDKDGYLFSKWIVIGWTVPGQKMEIHNDHQADLSIKDKDFHQPLLTSIFYLSHECDGGNLRFPDIDMEITPSSGSLVIFPSEENHQVLEYLKGERIVMQRFVFKSLTQ